MFVGHIVPGEVGSSATNLYVPRSNTIVPLRTMSRIKIPYPTKEWKLGHDPYNVPSPKTKDVPACTDLLKRIIAALMIVKSSKTTKDEVAKLEEAIKRLNKLDKKALEDRSAAENQCVRDIEEEVSEDNKEPIREFLNSLTLE